jgi:hypothetical protein
MKRAMAVGIRHLPLSVMVRDELRTALSARDANAAETVANLLTRSLWAALISDHLDTYGAAPSREDCASYRLLAEYIAGDAIDSIDHKLAHCFTKTTDADPLLTEARALKRITDAMLSEEAARIDIAIDEMHASAHRRMRVAL